MDKHGPNKQAAARVEAGRQKMPISREGFVLASLGLAFCISAPEAVRYTALWNISDEGSLVGIVSKAGFLVACFLLVRWAAVRGRVPLYRNTPLLWALALLQVAGFALLLVHSLGWSMPPWFVYVRTGLLDSSLFLFAAFASFYLRIDVKAAITSFVVGVVAAGTVQICAALLPFPAAAGLTLLLAPCSVLLLRCADRRIGAEEAWYSSLPDHERAVFGLPSEAPDAPKGEGGEPSEKSPVGGLYATIALLSFIVAAIHLSWRSIQDGGMTSIMVQVCAGVGAVLAGNILIVVRRYLEDREVVEFARLIVLPIAIGTLYFASLLDGTLLVLAVIPLNIVYVAVLLLAWLAPFFYAHGREPVAVSCDAFLAKRLGVIVGIGLMRDLAVGAFAWVSGALIVVALVGLVALSFVQFLSAKRRAERAGAHRPVQVSLDAGETRNLACALVAERFRLTPRERDVLELLVRGRTAGYIAEELVISDTTAKTHIKHIYQKAGVRSKQTLLDIVEVESGRLAGRDADG